MQPWYYLDSWSWASTWGGGPPKPTRVYGEMTQMSDYNVIAATATLDTSLPHNTNRSFLWKGSEWVIDHFWPGDMPRDAVALPGPDVTPPSGFPWWTLVPAIVAALIVYDVVGPRRWI